MSRSWSVDVDGASLKVEVGFGADPSIALASVSWTDITAYVRSLSIQQGRSTTLDEFQAARLSMLVDNRDRRFDPGYTSGPYYSNLKPMRRVRVSFTYSATTVTWFVGYINAWPQDYNPPHDASVVITATDAFTILNRYFLPSVYAVEVAADSPAVWYRLGETQGSTAVDSSGNNADGIYRGGATFNSTTGLVTDGADHAIRFDGVDDDMLASLTLSAFPFTVEFWMSQTLQTFTYYIAATGPTLGFQVYVDPGHITVGLADDSHFLNRSSTGNTYNDGERHHVAAVFTGASTAPTLYIDGTSDTGGSFTASGPCALPGNTQTIFAPNLGGGKFAGTLDEFAVYNSNIGATRIAAHYTAGTSPWAGLDTGTAVGNVLDLIGWPSADRDIETGISTVIALDIAGRSALDILKELERTEQGRFFLARDGKLTFWNRHHVITTAASTTSQAAFGDGPGELKYADVRLSFDDTLVRNSSTVNRSGGSSFTATDLTSIGDYGTIAESVGGVLNADDGDLIGMAQWRIAHYAQPLTAIDALEVRPRRDAANIWPQVRDRRLGDRVTVNRRPQAIGSALSVVGLVEGVNYNATVSPLELTATYVISPIDTAGSFFILDDTTFGVLDTDRLAW